LDPLTVALHVGGQLMAAVMQKLAQPHRESTTGEHWLEPRCNHDFYTPPSTIIA
jgi:hypothetical protein